MDATHTSNCSHCAALGHERQWNQRTLRQGLCKKGYAEAKAAGTLPVRRLPKGEKRQCEAVTDGKRCPENAKAHGLCGTHVARYYRGAEINAPVRDGAAQAAKCSFDGCTNRVHADDLCAGHITQKRRGKLLTPLRSYKPRAGKCSLDNCDRDIYTDDLCNTHYTRRQKGDPDWRRPIRAKAKDGDGWLNDDGYYMLHKNGRSRGQHLWIAEDLLGRSLRRGENVHHRNGNRSDNHVDGPFVMTRHGKLLSGNLEVWSTKQPPGQEIGPKLDWAFQMIEDYLQYLDPARARHLLALAAQVTPEMTSTKRERELAALDEEVAG